MEFNLNAPNFKDYLKKTTENVDEKLWKRIFNFEIDTSVFKNDDYDLGTPLETIANKKLIYSFILHYLGRGIFCSKIVHDRFKEMLSVRLKETINQFNEDHKDNGFASLNSLENHSIEEIISPYIQLAPDYKKWSDEEIPWDQFVSEISFRETIMSKLRDKYSRYFLRESEDFFTDFLANLQFDNYCFKSIRSHLSNKEATLTNERNVCWIFPLDVEIKVEQKKEILGYRRDSIYTKIKKHNKRLEMNNIEKDLDPYAHGGHIRSLLNNEPLELEYYLKKHPGRQLISEMTFVMFGIEVQKNPASLIYNMMLIDLIDGDKVTQREVFYSDDSKYSKDRGYGGLAPFSMNGATTAARFLNIYYSYIFDHWYSYDINDDNESKIIENLMNPMSDYNVKRDFKMKFDELMQREYELVNKWLEYKKERDRKARSLKNIQELFNYIFSKTVEFYEQYKFHVK